MIAQQDKQLARPAVQAHRDKQPARPVAVDQTENLVRDVPIETKATTQKLPMTGATSTLVALCVSSAPTANQQSDYPCGSYMSDGGTPPSIR